MKLILTSFIYMIETSFLVSVIFSSEIESNVAAELLRKLRRENHGRKQSSCGKQANL